MLIAKFTSQIPTMGDTKTVEDWSKYIGMKPHRMGVIARMYPNNTLNFLTDSLRNIFYNGEKESKYQISTSMMFEWEIETNQIKHIEFAEAPDENAGQNGEEILMTFKENYYRKYDIFRVDETKQQFICMGNPVRKADNYWQIPVRHMADTFDVTLDVSGCQPGMTTTFQSTANKEMHAEGYCKFQSSFEKHRNYMSTFRCDTSWSSLYALQEQVFMSIVDDKDKTKGEGVYKMVKKEKELLDTFNYVVSSGLLLNKGTVNDKGITTLQDPDTQTPIYVGQGLIPQIEQAASKFTYSGRPSVLIFQKMMSSLIEHCDDETGNKWVFIVNRKLWEDLNIALGDYLIKHKTDGTYLYSNASKSYVRVDSWKVGATFSSYEFSGNTISFMPDRSLTREYPNKGYGVLIDLTADKTTGTPAIAKFSLTGKDAIINKIEGVGGADGKTSGSVSTPVAATKMVMHTYAGVAAFTPHRSAIILEV